MNVVRVQMDSNVYVVKREWEKGKESSTLVPAIYLIDNVFLSPETVDTMNKRNLYDRLSYWHVEDRQRAGYDSRSSCKHNKNVLKHLS